MYLIIIYTLLRSTPYKNVRAHISALQRFSVLSTIAQVLRKMSLKILASLFFMPHLSQTFESYQRVKIYIQCISPWFEEIFTVKWNLQAFYSLQIEHYAIKIAFCIQCYSVLYFTTAYFSVYGVNSYTSLNRNDFLYLTVFDLVSCLA